MNNTTINGAWSAQENAWVSETICLTGNSFLNVKLATKGRMILRKSETSDGPWPKVLSSPWTGPDFNIRIFGSTKGRYLKIYLTSTPTEITIANI